MSVGPLGIAGSAAGSHLAQTKGTDTEKVQQEAANQARELESAENAEQADGVGETEEDQESSDRDADGRRPWQRQKGGEAELQDEETASDEIPSSKDPDGQCGLHVDLSG